MKVNREFLKIEYQKSIDAILEDIEWILQLHANRGYSKLEIRNLIEEVIEENYVKLSRTSKAYSDSKLKLIK